VKGHPIGLRKPDEGKVEVKSIIRRDGVKELLEVHQIDGALGILDHTETGDPHFIRLEVTKLIVRENNGRPPRYAPYVGLKLPAELALRLGKREIAVAVHTTAEDTARGFNRTAHVRMIAPGTRYFGIYRRLRGDSESLNRNLEDTLYRHHRAHSRGWRGQQLDMLGFAGLVNALTRARFRKPQEQRAA
jgi:hypothetical protein